MAGWEDLGVEQVEEEENIQTLNVAIHIYIKTT